MVTDFIYGTPTWVWGSIFMLLLCGSACVGLIVFDRLVHVDIRRAHNELAGFTVAVISVVYAVLLAFIAIATWESYTTAEDVVQSEADYVGSIYRDTQGVPPQMGQDVRNDLELYVKTVVNQEWPVQHQGRTPDQGWEPLARLHLAIVRMQPRTMGESVIQAELLRTLNELYRARESRLSAAEGHIPPVIWWIIFLGGALVTAFTYLFGFHDLRMHLVMTLAVAASMGFVVVLIIALDWPFRGRVSIAPDAFVKVEQSWKTIPSASEPVRAPAAPTPSPAAGAR
jgi:hypothetical protein